MENQNDPKRIEILLVEDNPGDIRLASEALSESKLKNNLNVVMDGVEALQYLRHEGKYTDSPTPDIILLDLNLPKKDGVEVLQEIKSDDQLKHIPVLILTSSKADEDVYKTFNLHANCYISKPLDMFQFMHVIKGIEDFWFSIVKLPHKKQ